MEKKKNSGWELATGILLVIIVVEAGLLWQQYETQDNEPYLNYEGFELTKAQLDSFEVTAPKDKFGRFTVCNTDLNKCLIVGKIPKN